MKYARLVGASVAEVFVGVNDLTGEAVGLADVFPPGVAVLFVECPDEVQPGWTYQGGVWAAPAPPAPTATPAPAVPDPNMELVARQLVLVVDDHINRTAQALSYDSIVTAVSYADEPAVPKFQAEGAALRAWRSLVYARLYELQAEALQGLRTIPTPTELIALLPAFVAPVV